MRHASPFRRFVSAFTASPAAVLALVVLEIAIVLAVGAALLAVQNPYDLAGPDVIAASRPPLTAASDGLTYWLGTDDQGRDLLSGMLYGLRISLAAGFGSVLLAGIIGGLVGCVLGNIGGWCAALGMRLINLQLSLPPILIALMILAFIGKGVFNVMLALVLVQWVSHARVAYDATVAARAGDRFAAAQGLALPRLRILLRHVLPDCFRPLLVMAAGQVARAITLEATLSFLGLGMPAASPSLGLLIANGMEQMLAGQYWISLFPGLALLVVLVSINLVSDQLSAVLHARSAP